MDVCLSGEGKEGGRGPERIDNLPFYFKKDLMFHLDSLKLLLKRPEQLHEVFKSLELLNKSKTTCSGQSFLQFSRGQITAY